MKNNLRIGIIGLNGIGSYFVRGLSELLRQDIQGFNKINPLEVTGIDGDNIEEKNLSYTLYDVEHIDRNKAKVTSELTGFRAVCVTIENAKELEAYDFIILAVDNNKVRNIVYNSGKPFLDLRAKGRTILAFLTQKDLDKDKEYEKMTQDTGAKGGCQYQTDIEERNIQLGNRVIAEIGLQLLKDYLQDEIEHKQVVLQV